MSRACPVLDRRSMATGNIRKLNSVGRLGVAAIQMNSCSQADRFNHLDVFIGESELFGLEILCHMLWVRRAG
jgi:hypothetical protein